MSYCICIKSYNCFSYLHERRYCKHSFDFSLNFCFKVVSFTVFLWEHFSRDLRWQLLEELLLNFGNLFYSMVLPNYLPHGVWYNSNYQKYAINCNIWKLFCALFLMLFQILFFYAILYYCYWNINFITWHTSIKCSHRP